MGQFGLTYAVLLGVLGTITGLTTSASAGQMAVTLAWDPSPQVAGFLVYQGTASRNYTNVIDAGNSTHATVLGLDPGVINYFAVAAYDAFGLVSSLSDEISLSPQSVVPQVMVVGIKVQAVVLGGTGVPGRSYDIFSSSDSSPWRVIGTVTLGDTGVFRFLDNVSSNAASLTYSYQLRAVTVPEPAPGLTIQTAPGQINLSGFGIFGHSYDILATTDFRIWRNIGSVMAGPGGTFSFVVPSAKRVGFFRLHETTYTVPGTLPALGIRPGTNNQVTLEVTGQIGHNSMVSATQDFITWTPIGMGLAGTGGVLSFDDPIQIGSPARFYRVAEVLP